MHHGRNVKVCRSPQPYSDGNRRPWGVIISQPYNVFPVGTVILQGLDITTNYYLFTERCNRPITVSTQAMLFGGIFKVGRVQCIEMYAHTECSRKIGLTSVGLTIGFQYVLVVFFEFKVTWYYLSLNIRLGLLAYAIQYDTIGLRERYMNTLQNAIMPFLLMSSSCEQRNAA